MQVDDLSEELRLQAGIAEDSGVVVIEIEPGGSAEGAGIQAGDVIKEVNRSPVKDLGEYQSALSRAKGTTLLLQLKRGKQTLFASLEAQ
jgi:serine protease Do